MPKKPEEIIEDEVCEGAEELDIGNRKVQWIGRKGSPDRLFAGYGRLLLVEFKRPGIGRKLDSLQVIDHKWFLAHGIQIEVFDNTEIALEFMKVYFNVPIYGKGLF